MSYQEAAVPELSLRQTAVRIACITYLITAWLATVASWIEVESIVGGFPILILVGSIVIFFALQRSSWMLLSYGLSPLWIVGGLSLTIAVFDLDPGEAQPIVPGLLCTYTYFLTSWCAIVLVELQRNPQLLVKRNFKFRFSMRALMIVTTVVCVMAALGRLISWQSEMWMFGSGGFALIGISGVILYWFALRMRLASEK